MPAWHVSQHVRVYCKTFPSWNDLCDAAEHVADVEASGCFAYAVTLVGNRQGELPTGQAGNPRGSPGNTAEAARTPRGRPGNTAEAARTPRAYRAPTRHRCAAPGVSA